MKKKTFRRLCELNSGLEAEVEDERLLALRPEAVAASEVLQS